MQRYVGLPGGVDCGIRLAGWIASRRQRFVAGRERLYVWRLPAGRGMLKGQPTLSHPLIFSPVIPRQ